MSKDKKKVVSGKTLEDGESEAGKGGRSEARAVLLKVAVFVLFIGIAIAVFIRIQRDEAKIETEMQASALPEGMPRLVPFPKSILTIDPTQNRVEDYTYTMQGGDDPTAQHEGKMYTIIGSSDRTPTEIRDFYNNLLLDKGYRQRINISLPSGHRLDLENDKNIVSLEVERKKDAKQTSVKIVIYD